MSGKRLVWADALKGVLIILVVLGHSIQASMIKLEISFIDDYLWNLIYSFHMPAFIAVSGFLAFRKTVVGGGKNEWASFAWRRLRQLIIPFLLWSVALFFVNHNVTHYYDYMLYPQRSLWFLWALFFIAIIFAGVDIIAVRLKVKQELAMLICWLLLVVCMFLMPDAKLLGVEYVTYYFLYYLLGYYMNKYSEKLIIKNNWIIALLGIVWFAFGSIYSTQGLPKELQFIPMVPHSALYMVYRMLTAVIAIFFLFGLGIKLIDEDKGTTALFVKLGQVSLGIYAIHMVLRFRLVDLIIILLPSVGYWPVMIATFCSLLPISYGIIWLLSRSDITSTLLLGKIK